MNKRQIMGRILILLFNLTVVAVIVMLTVDKEWGGLVVIVPLALVSFCFEIDELIHSDKYVWE